MSRVTRGAFPPDMLHLSKETAGKLIASHRHSTHGCESTTKISRDTEVLYPALTTCSLSNSKQRFWVLQGPRGPFQSLWTTQHPVPMPKSPITPLVSMTRSIFVQLKKFGTPAGRGKIQSPVSCKQD